MSDTPTLHQPLTAWVLAGGEGRRVNGQDKGLLKHGDRPLAEWVGRKLASQCDALACSANRNLGAYRDLMARCRSHAHPPPADAGTWPDDPDLTPGSGPLAGLLTALRHSHTEWVLVAACDTPRLPVDLAARLLRSAQAADADIAVPVTTDPDGQERHHWVCVLLHKRVTPRLQEAFVNGERKVGSWMRSQHWVAVCFDSASDFHNINTLETLHGRD